MPLTISALYSYPIKSCAGLQHDSLELVATGPAYDRHWMITEPDGTFITQRTHPQMALIRPHFDGDDLVLNAPNMSAVRVPLVVPDDHARRPVTVWRDTVLGADEGDEVAAWLSDYLHESVRLFAMPPETVRPVDPKYAKTPAQVGFSDGYPLLVFSTASLDDLNAKLTERGKATVTVAHFRPNIVVTDVDAPFAEDGWNAFTVGGLSFDVVKPCARCKITTVDPTTGTVTDPQEPSATLALYRRGESGVLFGQNVIHRSTGTVHVGASLDVR
jgi:uncharacterized protein YcbX